jgi:hypothetical protein
MQKLILPFISGFLAVLFFREPTVALLSTAQLPSVTAYPTTPVPYAGIPEFLGFSLVGGLLGILEAWLLRVDPSRPAPWTQSLVYGAAVMTSVSIFLVGPALGLWPTGNLLPRIVFGAAVNAMWGWGALVFIRAFSARPYQQA